MKQVCFKSCFYNGKLWKVGEEWSSSTGQRAPTLFFKEVEGAPKEPRTADLDGPRSFAEFQGRDTRQATESLKGKAEDALTFLE